MAAVWALITLAFCAGVIVLAGRLYAQPLGCLQIDRYGELCIPSTGDIFVQDAHQKLASDGWVDRSTNKKGERCCDAGKDCHAVLPERVLSHRDGVMLPDYNDVVIPGSEIMPSEDGRYWVCYWGGRVRCFFAPYSGS